MLARLARELRPRVVRAVFGFDLPDRSDVRWSAELGGGALMDVGCYCLSALRLVCGEPERASAEAVGDDVDARIAAVLRFPGDVVGTFECAMDMAPRMELEVVGERGTLRVVPWPAPGDITIERGGGTETVASEPADPFALELEAFRAAVEDGAPLPFGRSDAVAQARAIELVSAAAARARRPGAA